MCTRRTALFSATTLLAFGITFAGNAHASFAECDNINNNVNPSLDCQILEPLDDKKNDSTELVNNQEFFGFSDWWFDGKWDDDEGKLIEDEDDEPTLADFDGNAQEGDWSLNDVSAYSDLMFVFKDGADTNLVGYLIDVAVDDTGNYASPFTTPPFDIKEEKNISHISIYARGEGVQIPAPGILGLMGIGLVGLFAAGSGRRRA